MIDLLQTNRPRSAATAIGAGADQPNREEGTSLPPSVRVAALLTEYSCALCSLKTQFSFCHLAAPLCGWSSGAQRPFAIVKDDIFCVAGLDRRQKFGMLRGKIEKLSRQFFFFFYFNAQPRLLKLTSHIVNLLQWLQ